MSSTQKTQLANAYQIAEKPLIVLDKMKNGTLSSTDIKTLSTLYPSLYARMQQKVMGEIVTTQQKDKTIPYKTKMALSLFMGQALDSSLQPASIISSQATSQSGKQAIQQAQSQTKGVKSSPALQKMPQAYTTPGQASEGRRSKTD
jgi:hypothetical protein